MNMLLNGDCLELMQEIPDGSIDLIFCDLPYGITACKWDSTISLDRLWEQYNRIIKPNRAIVLTASQPFTSVLVQSNVKNFKHEWIYKKRCASNFAQARYAPMKEHESVLVFANGKALYNPIKEERVGGGKDRAKYKYNDSSRHSCGEFVGNINGAYNKETDSGNDILRFPSSVQEFNNRAAGDRGLHPTQKPVLLCEYFIKTYSNEGDLVLDNCMGSGSTGIACINTNRGFIGIEKDDKYFKIAKRRIEQQRLINSVSQVSEI